MASFFRNAFDNLLNSISSTLNTTISRNSASQNQNNTRTNGQFRSQPSNRNFTPSSTGQHNRNRPCGCCGGMPNNPPPQTDQERRSNHHHHHQQQQQQQRRSHQQFDTNMNNTSTNTKNEIRIEDIKDLSDVDSLSTKQLKTILSVNCIDYKGVLEKEELKAKTRILWFDLNEKKERRRVKLINKSCDSIDDIEDKKLCKICMEREIDSVLLECGHLLSCIDCGKKLTDCPICRSIVTRCVRTFQV